MIKKKNLKSLTGLEEINNHIQSLLLWHYKGSSNKMFSGLIYAYFAKCFYNTNLESGAPKQEPVNGKGQSVIEIIVLIHALTGLPTFNVGSASKQGNSAT